MALFHRPITPCLFLMLLVNTLILFSTITTAEDVRNVLRKRGRELQEDEVGAGGEEGSAAAAEEEDMVRVLVGFSDPQDQADFVWERQQTNSLAQPSSVGATTAATIVSLGRSNAVAMTIPATELQALTDEINNDPNSKVTYIEQDPLRYTQGRRRRRQSKPHLKQDRKVQEVEEVVPYGIDLVLQNANGEQIPKPPPATLDDKSCFRVCIIDSGLEPNHADIPFEISDKNVDGASFGLRPRDYWYNPNEYSGHGTEVAGIMFATGGNGIGVTGVIPDDQGMCLLVARIFDETGSQYASDILHAVEWCAENGARVINMSLGGPDYSFTEMIAYQKLYNNDGILVVAAAGNGGNGDYLYPASYPDVISVGGVNATLDHDPYSQYNDQVDLAAPGVDVITTSTAPNIDITYNGGTALISGGLMELSPGFENFGRLDQLELVDCGAGFEVCAAAKGKICIMERGVIQFWEKAFNCQKGGGKAAMIYNNSTETFGGTLTEDGFFVSIPVIAIQRTDGLLLLDQQPPNNFVNITISKLGYATLSGTSFAAPHVSGVATKIWAARPNCTNAQIQEALFNSTMDLGAVGRDDYFGHGFVQAIDAYNYVLNNFDSPCGDLTIPEQASPPPTLCRDNYESCSEPSDCCSGQCREVASSGRKVCRPMQKANRQRLGGGRGGAGGVG